MSPKREKSADLYERAHKVLPLGVSSNFRSWGAERTLYFQKAEGPYIWDVDDNRYIDYRMGFGPVLLGHSYPPVVEAVRKVLESGTIHAMGSEYEIRVAEKVCQMCGLDMIRYACSGTEATMHAIRVARAYTGRDKLLKFEGMYHGMHDYVLFSTYPEVANLGAHHSPISVPASSGIPRPVHDLVITVPFNDFEVLESTMRRVGHELAAIILEPLGMGNCASIEPVEGFIKFLREQCDQYGALLIMDEVKSGFRVETGGAQAVHGVKADLLAYAKSIANGFPLALFGGRREIMSVIGDGVAHGGTYTGNLVGAAAADVVTDLLADGHIVRTIAAQGNRLKQGLGEIFSQHSIPHHFQGPPTLFGILFSEEKVTDYRGWAKTDYQRLDRFLAKLIEMGVMPDPDCREPWYISLAHTNDIVDVTLQAAEDVVKAGI